jgi:hypothetical protein
VKQLHVLCQPPQQAVKGSSNLVDAKRRCTFTYVLPLQVLHYQEGEQYVEHWDYFHDTVNVKNGGQRTATALIYLSEVDQGAAEGVGKGVCI